MKRKGNMRPPARVTLRVADPFETPAADRRIDRRLRARLVGPVTVWTAGTGTNRAGLTVSAVLVAEGDPAVLVGFIDPLSDLYDMVLERGRFLVHVLGTGDQRLAGMFAGSYPADPFAEVVTVEGIFGPVISGTRHLVGCELLGAEDVGFQALVRGRIESIELLGSSPLVRYRGQYRKLSQER